MTGLKNEKNSCHILLHCNCIHTGDVVGLKHEKSFSQMCSEALGTLTTQHIYELLLRQATWPDSYFSEEFWQIQFHPPPKKIHWKTIMLLLPKWPFENCTMIIILRVATQFPAAKVPPGPPSGKFFRACSLYYLVLRWTDYWSTVEKPGYSFWVRIQLLT